MRACVCVYVRAVLCRNVITRALSVTVARRHRSARISNPRGYNVRRSAGSRAAPQESSGRVSTFRFYSLLVGRSAAPLRVKFVALRCARCRVRGALSRGVHHRAFDCASPCRAAAWAFYLSTCPLARSFARLSACLRVTREREQNWRMWKRIL